MKHLKLCIFAAAAALVTLASCKREDPYVITVDAPGTFTYIDHKFDEAQVFHRTTLSSSKFNSVFPIKVNKAKHDEVRATLTYDRAAAEAYNAQNGTDYPILEENYIALSKYGGEGASLEWVVPSGERFSVDSVQFALKGELANLQEPVYLAAYKLNASGSDVSEEYGTYILKVTTEHTVIRKISALSDLIGSSPADNIRSKWTADVANYASWFTGNGVYSNRTTYPSLTANQDKTITIDLKEEHLVTGLKFYSRNYSRFSAREFEYSSDGENFTTFGDATGKTINVREGSAYVTAVAFYDYVPLRYVRFIARTTSASYPMTGFNITEVSSAGAEISVVGANSYEGKIIHNLATDKHTSDFVAQIAAMTTLSSAGGYTVSAEYDGSLVAAYNASHGTAYEALPAANLKISGSPVKIAPGEMASEAFEVSLTGELSSLTADAGYIAPIALKSNDAPVGSNSVVYLILKNSYVYLLSGISSAPGTEVKDKSGWSVTADVPSHSVYGSGNINSIIDNNFDRDGVSHYQFYRNGVSRTNIIVNFGKTLNVSGVRVNPTDLPCMDYDVAFSTDGVNFTEMGTASMGSGTMANLDSDGVCAFYKVVPMTHLRVTMYSGYFGMYELGVFVK